MKIDLRGTLLASTIALAAATGHAEEIVIGVPIAQTGPIAFVGVPGLKAMQLAVDEANETHVLGAGRTIKIVTADDGSDRTQAVTLVNRMIKGDHALILVGPAGTNSALAGAAVANEQQIAMIGIATSPTITTVGKYSFHIMGSPNLQIGSVLSYVYDHYKPKTVATVWGRDNDGAMSQGKFARQWLEGKVTLLPEESVLTNDSDFTALATKLAFANPDVVFVTPSSEASGANLIRQLRQGGVKSIIVGPSSMSGLGFIQTAGKASDGVIVGADYTPTRTDKLNQDFVAAYTKRFGIAPDNSAGNGYTAMWTAIHAIAGAGPNPTRTAVRDALEKTTNLPVVTGSGLFSFDKDREPSYSMAIVVAKDGQWTVAPK